MRLFIAAPLPLSLQTAILTHQTSYHLQGVRLVPAANLHLTLQFLGETPQDLLPVLLDKLAKIAQAQEAFDLDLKEIAPGPKLKSPRLVWARFWENPKFEALAKAIIAAMPPTGNVHPDFIPHITIARLKKEKLSGSALPVIKEINFQPYPVKEIALWESVLGSPHPQYTVLQTFTLAPAGQKN